MVHNAREWFQYAGQVTRQYGFAGREPVITQDEIRDKAVGNREGGEGAIAAIVGGDVQVGSGELGARYPKGTWKIKFMNENCGDARIFGRRVEKDCYRGLSDKRREGCSGHRRGRWRETRREGALVMAQ